MVIISHSSFREAVITLDPSDEEYTVLEREVVDTTVKVVYTRTVSRISDYSSPEEGEIDEREEGEIIEDVKDMKSIDSMGPQSELEEDANDQLLLNNSEGRAAAPLVNRNRVAESQDAVRKHPVVESQDDVLRRIRKSDAKRRKERQRLDKRSDKRRCRHDQ